MIYHCRNRKNLSLIIQIKLPPNVRTKCENEGTREIHNENKFRDMKNLHMERLESIETKHASFITDMEADWSSKLEEQKNDHINAVENAQNHRLEIEEKYSAILSKLKSRHTKYWTNLSKSQVLRTWREGALMLRLQRYREKSTSHIFKRYNRLRRKHSFAKWYIYTRNRIHKRAILGHIFGNSMRRKIFVFFHFWRRRHQQDYYRSVNDHKQLSMAISSWRQLENKRIRKDVLHVEGLCLTEYQETSNNNMVI